MTSVTLVAAFERAIHAPEIQKLPIGKALAKINAMPSGYGCLTIGEVAEVTSMRQAGFDKKLCDAFSRVLFEGEVQ